MAGWKKVVVESTSGTITQNTSGSAATLTNSRTISLGSDLSGSASFDGSANITIAASISDNAVDAAALNVTGDGNAGQVLSSDGDGSFSWANASSGTLAGLSDTDISSPSGGHILVHDNIDSFNNVAMSGEGTLTSTGVFTLATTIANDHTFSGNITVSGDLTVNGNTTTINTQTLTVEDKLIKLADVATPTTTTANGGGIQIESSGTEANWPELKWNSSTELTGWTLSDHTTGTSTDFPVAVMQFGTAAPSSPAIETEAGDGAFFFDTTNDSLYVFTG